MSSKSKKEIENLVGALDDAPLDDETVTSTVERLGVDVKSLAASIRAQVAASDEVERKKRFDMARAAYAEEVIRLERGRVDAPKRTREENLVLFRALLAKAPAKGQSVAMHFLKYESASDEELEELLRSLRHLLGEDDSE